MQSAIVSAQPLTNTHHVAYMLRRYLHALRATYMYTLMYICDIEAGAIAYDILLGTHGIVLKMRHTAALRGDGANRGAQSPWCTLGHQIITIVV